MDVFATMTSKGQVTLPKPVRDALDLHAGDRILFRVHEDRAVFSKIPNFLDLAGSMPVPPDRRGASWEEIREETRRLRAQERR